MSTDKLLGNLPRGGEFFGSVSHQLLYDIGPNFVDEDQSIADHKTDDIGSTFVTMIVTGAPKDATTFRSFWL